MTELAILSFTTFFAAVAPVDVAVMLAVLSPGADAAARNSTARRAVGLAAIILFLFALAGDSLFRYLGISLAALQVAGGVLLMMMGINMVYATPSGAVSTTDDENQEARTSKDISIFPLATPLIAGPGAISSLLVLTASAAGVPWGWALVLASLAAVLLVTLLLMFMANRLQRLLGVTGSHVISRVIGILLAALAVQFIFDGLEASPLFS